MYIFEQEDVREKIENILERKDFSVEVLKTVILEFVQSFENKSVFENLFTDNEIFTHFATKLNLVYDYSNVESLFEAFVAILDSADLLAEEKEEFLVNFAEMFIDNSDDADFCDTKIFVVIKNIDGKEGNNIVNEYNSLDEAIKDTDETYIGCCDDIFWGESVLFTLLCALQEDEYDYVVNYCKVFEYDAKYLEEGREAWEAENCDDDE